METYRIRTIVSLAMNQESRSKRWGGEFCNNVVNLTCQFTCWSNDQSDGSCGGRWNGYLLQLLQERKNECECLSGTRVGVNHNISSTHNQWNSLHLNRFWHLDSEDSSQWYLQWFLWMPIFSIRVFAVQYWWTFGLGQQCRLPRFRYDFVSEWDGCHPPKVTGAHLHPYSCQFRFLLLDFGLLLFFHAFVREWKCAHPSQSPFLMKKLQIGYLVGFASRNPCTDNDQYLKERVMLNYFFSKCTHNAGMLKYISNAHW